MKTREKQICVSCLEEFIGKEVYWINKMGYQVLHCMMCIEKKGIEKYEPYSKPRKRKTKE